MTTLQDVLPYEFRGCEYSKSPARKHANVEVVETVDGCKAGQGWPGPQTNAFWWYRLANGYAVGFNENPSRGWSFPVVKLKVA